MELQSNSFESDNGQSTDKLMQAWIKIGTKSSWEVQPICGEMHNIYYNSNHAFRAKMIEESTNKYFVTLYDFVGYRESFTFRADNLEEAREAVKLVSDGKMSKYETKEYSYL